MDLQTSSAPPVLLSYRSAKWFIVTVVSLTVFTDTFLYGVIVPVFPFALTKRAGVAPDRVQHYVSILLAVYGAALIASSPICGYLADRAASRRLPLMLGWLALAGSTVMLMIGNSVGILIAGRLLQGISATVSWVVGLALLVDTVGQEGIGQAMGYVALGINLGLLAAPLLGGIIYQHAGYYAVFAICLGLIAVDMALRAVMIERKFASRWPVTQLGAGCALCKMMPGSKCGASKELSSSSSTSLDDTSDVAAYNPRSTRETEETEPRSKKFTRYLPPVITLLGSPRLLAALWGCLVTASFTASFDSVLPLFARNTFGWNSQNASLLFIPLVLPSFLAPVTGTVSDRYGPRWLATFGFLLACPLFVCLRFVTHSSVEQKVLLCALLALASTAWNLVFAPLAAEITYALEAKEKTSPGLAGHGGAYAQAYSLYNTAWAGGCLLGPIWAGFLNEKAGWSTMTWTLGLLSAVTAVPTVIYAGGLITEKRKKSTNAEMSEHREVSVNSRILTMKAF